MSFQKYLEILERANILTQSKTSKKTLIKEFNKRIQNVIRKSNTISEQKVMKYFLKLMKALFSLYNDQRWSDD